MRKLKGFMGLTHALISIALMALCMILPLPFLQSTFGELKENIPLFIVALVVLVGGALLPDLDNVQSSAGSTLGPLGDMFTLFMKSTSSIMWNIYHFKGDMRPLNQHRYLWHSFIVGFGIIGLFYFGLPKGEYTIITNLSNSISTGQLNRFLQTNAVLFLFIILCFMAVLVGSNMLIYRINKIIHLPFYIKYIFPVLVLVYIGMANYSELRILGVCLGAGYFFHCLEDVFADTGCVALWPIPNPIKKQVWWRVKFPITITTGGGMNSVIDLVAFVAAVGLLILAFTS